MSDALAVKWRPTNFDEVTGHHAVVKSLENVLNKKTAQTFLFEGPSGCGKTTLARIAAVSAGCGPEDIREIDGATYTGVDAMRQIQQYLQYKPLGNVKARAILIDECHALSKAAWQSLLKAVEEPPAGVFWFFCTTEGGRVPATIRTRAVAFKLKLLTDKELDALVREIAGLEKIKLDETVRQLIVKEARGSARQALVNLAVCQNCTSKKEAAELLSSALESEATIELARFLMQPGSWKKAMSIYARLSTENPESVRIVVSNYVAGAVKNARSDREAMHFLQILECFSQPYNASDGSAALLRSIGQVVFSG